MPSKESHRTGRAGWLRAAVLGANDGTISVASLVVGVAAGGASPHSVLLTALAGLVGGTVAMAAGEYVSVQSQADTEDADIAKEKLELERQPDRELAELAEIYVARGLTPELARRVAEQLMSADAVGAHSRDELGITETLRARPVQAAFASAISFATGASIPIATVIFSPAPLVAHITIAAALLSLIILGGAAAYAGGASVVKGALRVAFWGALAMGLTAVVGNFVGGKV